MGSINISGMVVFLLSVFPEHCILKYLFIYRKSYCRLNTQPNIVQPYYLQYVNPLRLLFFFISWS